MNDSIENNDQHTSNQSSQVRQLSQGIVRSLSGSSSSSFDSCSDLLGSLENAAENLEDFSRRPHIDCKKIKPRDDANCYETTSQSESMLGSAILKKECEHFMTEEAPLHSEVKNEIVKVESASVKDHVYGFSNAILFSKAKFLAENTVERISQLQTSFRLPTSYIFPVKNVPQTDNTSETSAASEVYGIHKEHLAGKEEGDAGDDILNTGKDACTEISILLPNELGDADASSRTSKIDDVHAEGVSTEANYGAMEQGINILNKENGSENVYAENSLKVIEDISGAGATTQDDVQSSDVSMVNGIGTTDASSRGLQLDRSKNSDLDIVSCREGLQQEPVEDSCSQQLETATTSSDFHTKSSAFCHPLRTLSSGSGRPDLEEVDDEQNIAGGLLPKGPPIDLFDTASTSADSSLNIDSHDRVKNEAYMQKGIDLDHDAYISRVHHSSSSGQNAGFFARSCTNQGRELILCDQPTLGESVDTENSECRQGLPLTDQALEDEERWKGLSIRLPSELRSDQREKKDSLDSDELCRYAENLELNETYVDTVLDMEDVLLNCDENSSRERFWLPSSSSVIGTPRSSRDGSLSSSTSGLHLFTLTESAPFTVDWVEVVGAKQRRGGSSLGERIVGVKDHTVYCIKVTSGGQEWEVLRRYRDFVDLYHQLRQKFNVRTGKSLPSVWKEVDKDSRKVFGSTHPNVVEVRSSRIENCLQSLLQAGPPLSTSSPLCWFLCPQSSTKGISFFENQNHHLPPALSLQKGQDVQLGSIGSPYVQSPRSELGSRKSELDHDKISASLGKTVKLNLKTHPNKNMKLLLSSQHHSCAGCYKHLEAERGLVHGFVQTLGWGKPRLCEYSGQLYCSSCHLNETAVLPAQVLWNWDFTPRRVSQLAKAYLDSIYDQPMLCVSAVNPYLYSRVPILSHVKETRRKLCKMLACMLCPSRTRILQTMGSRRYLMENNDFFALRDLEDLSKGAFAVLPSLLKAVLENLRVHITKQCPVCSETGEWCGAGVLCEEPFSPIFSFEEENITHCKVCHAPFHKACFSKLSPCPACSDNQSSKAMLAGVAERPQAGVAEHPQTGELAENYRDVALLLGGDEGIASPSSSRETDLQGRFELDRQLHTRKNWPSFYSLLPKPRLW